MPLLSDFILHTDDTVFPRSQTIYALHLYAPFFL